MNQEELLLLSAFIQPFLREYIGWSDFVASMIAVDRPRECRYLSQDVSTLFTGEIVLNWLLILTISATQVLPASCSALYLCVDEHGSICGVDSGPETCVCCHTEQELECDRDDCADLQLASDGSESVHKAHGVTRMSPATVECHLIEEECGCTHILLAVGQPTSATRARAIASHARLHHTGPPPVVSWQHEFVNGDTGTLFTRRPPGYQVYTLKVLTVTAIRC